MNEKFQKIFDERAKSNHFSNKMGVKTLEIEEGYAKTELAIKEDHYNLIKAVHGGCLYTLADTTGGTAAWSYGGTYVTVNSSFSYLRPALEPKVVTCEARCIKKGKQICVVHVEIKDEKGTLLNDGTFTYHSIPYDKNKIENINK